MGRNGRVVARPDEDYDRSHDGIGNTGRQYELRGRCGEEVCKYAGEYQSSIESGVLLPVL